MKNPKGTCGYIRREKRKRALQSGVSFGMVVIFLITGYIIHKTKLNWLTFFAIMFCLPAAKILVGYIALFPYHSLTGEQERDIKEKTAHLTMAYETVITSREKIMPVDMTAISDQTICCYSQSSKIDLTATAAYIKSMLAQNRLPKVSVKIFSDYQEFCKRAADMNAIAGGRSAEEQDMAKKKEEQIKNIILNISM